MENETSVPDVSHKRGLLDARKLFEDELAFWEGILGERRRKGGMSKGKGDFVDAIIERNIKEINDALSMGEQGVKELITKRINSLNKRLKEGNFRYREEKDEIEESLKKWQELLKKLEE